MSEDVTTNNTEQAPETGHAADGGGDSLDGVRSVATEGKDQQEDWRSVLPEEYRDASWAKKYQSIEDFAKGVDGMASVVGKKAEGVKVPGEDATEEDWNAFYAQLGRPETPDGYELKIPDGAENIFAEGDDKAAAEFLHKAGLTPQQAQAVINGYAEWAGEKMSAMSESVQASREQAEKTLKDEWGEKFDTNLQAAARGADAAGVTDYLEQSGLGNDPQIIKLAELAGRALSEDGSPEGGRAKAESMADIKAEYDQIIKNPNFFRDESLKARAMELSGKLYEDKEVNLKGFRSSSR